MFFLSSFRAVRALSPTLFALVGCAHDLSLVTRDASTATDARADVRVNPPADVVPDVPRPPPPSGDRCVTEQASARSTLGCNGWFEGEPPPRFAGGICSTDAPCETGSCAMGSGATQGRCFVGCALSSSYVTTGMCPTGFRCFQLSTGASCFRDCDEAHPCPSDQSCDGEGSCVPPR